MSMRYPPDCPCPFRATRCLIRSPPRSALIRPRSACLTTSRKLASDICSCRVNHQSRAGAWPRQIACIAHQSAARRRQGDGRAARAATSDERRDHDGGIANAQSVCQSSRGWLDRQPNQGPERKPCLGGLQSSREGDISMSLASSLAPLQAPSASPQVETPGEVKPQSKTRPPPKTSPTVGTIAKYIDPNFMQLKVYVRRKTKTAAARKWETVAGGNCPNSLKHR